MVKEDIAEIIKTSLITAFTIAAALIWKDFIEVLLKAIIPESKQLLSQFIAAILATVLVIIAIYFILKTEDEFEKIIRKTGSRINNKAGRKNNAARVGF